MTLENLVNIKETKVNKIDTQLTDDARVLNEKIAKWVRSKDTYEPIIEALEALSVEPTLSYDLDVSFTGDKRKLAAVVRILRTNGFKTESKAPLATSASWSAFFYSEKDKDKAPFSIWLSFSSSVCRRVQVGTQTVEQPIYEIRCEENISSTELLVDNFAGSV